MYLHKFYMHHSFLDVDHQAIATACLYLAIKADSRPVKKNNRIKVGSSLALPWSQFGGLACPHVPAAG